MMKDEWLRLAVYVLATWRVASLLVNEAGPWNLFRRIRELAGIEHDESGVKTIIPDGFFASLLDCVWCASIWVAAGWMVFDWLYPLLAVKVALIFSISAGAILVQRWVE